MNGRIEFDMPENEYHARPELSSTQARRILESPAKYRWLVDHPEPPRAVFDVGTAAHSKILGVGAGAVAYPDEHLTPSGFVSTKAATVLWAAEQRAAGLTPITPDQMDAVNAMAEAVLAHPTARVLLEQPGHPEASVFATDPDTGVGLRARFDFLPDDGPRPIAVDVKTALDASPRGFGKAVGNHGYYVQRGHYLDTLRLAGGHDLAEFLFVVVEKDPPHLVAVHQLERILAEAGIDRARQARHLYRECTDRDEWPGYPTDVHLVTAPYWLVAEQETYA